ncbi:aminotransferase class I/II-fold pyridoxal phosphate-dependent enzyme [Kibdelosporangium lantanae]|uniref:Aminotransferase class I/II-fold pyridoxal phosphate-dependent enzyme n=1 Tax=Kibdelosporangium lantanae TaxID=1497396 RepID=A0ABW3M206_9PSEU
MNDITIFCGGFKGALLGFCGSLLYERNYEELRPLGGRLLVPEGYYQSLRLIPPLMGAELSVTSDLTGESVKYWLTNTSGHPGRAVYVPLVNNADGVVLSRDRALGIAETILKHNQRHPDNPVFVIGDDVYEGAYLSPSLAPQPIGALTGRDLDNESLGRMSDYTLTVTTPSKTFAYPTSRIAFAATTNPTLRAAVGHYRTLYSHGRVPQVNELTAAAAICLTPQDWIDGWNRQCNDRLATVQADISNINTALGFEAFRLNRPQAGWYAALQVSPSLFTNEIRSAVDVFSVLLHYGEGKQDSGIALLPGELFGYRYRPDGANNMFVLRANIAVGLDVLREFTARLRDCAYVLRDRGAQVERYAKRRARSVADVDKVVTGLRY